MVDVKQFRDIEQVAGQPIELVISGKKLILSPLRIRDHASARNHLRIQSVQAYYDWLAILSEDKRPSIREQQEQISQLLRGRILDDQVFEWYGTAEGLQYFLWLSLHQKHPEITLDDVEALLGDETALQVLTAAISELTGLEAPTEGQGDSTRPLASPIPSGSPISPDSANSTDGH